jgi:poly(A) polymerase
LVGREMTARLRLSRADGARLEAALGWPEPVAQDPRATAYALGGTAVLDRMLIAGDPRARAWAGALGSWRPPRMPISGKHLIAMGVPPGPDVSRRLAEVEARWVAAGFPQAEEDALAIARACLGLR